MALAGARPAGAARAGTTKAEAEAEAQRGRICPVLPQALPLPALRSAGSAAKRRDPAIGAETRRAARTSRDWPGRGHGESAHALERCCCACEGRGILGAGREQRGAIALAARASPSALWPQPDTDLRAALRRTDARARVGTRVRAIRGPSRGSAREAVKVWERRLVKNMKEIHHLQARETAGWFAS